MSTGFGSPTLARAIARDVIAAAEARLAERFAKLDVDELRHHVQVLRDAAETPAERREADEAVARFNANAEACGLAVIS